MNSLTIQDIRDLKPCYDPDEYLPEDWTGTVEDILLLEDCPAKDRIWVAVRLMPRFLVECFAVDCALSAAAYDAAADDAAYAAYAAADAAYYAYAYAYAYAAADAYAAAYAAYDAARKQERENQIDALLMLLEGESDE